MPVYTAQERIGMTLAGKYSLTRVIGEGGMGVVFAGMNVDLRRPVALKMLRPEVSDTKDAVARFMTEAQTSAALRHPNVVDVLDVVREPDGSVYMVQELLDGRSLGAVLRAQRRLPPSQAYFALRPVMQALVAAHDAGIVHRDLKPDNIFFHRGRVSIVPKVLDFGIAKLMQASGNVTQTGMVMGTPRYMSPEQAQARDFGPWYDVWSIAVIWYELLTGMHPLELDRAMPATSMMLRIITETPRRLRAVAPSLPAPIADAIDAALTKSRRRRPDMRAFEQTLAAAFEAAGIGAEPLDIDSAVVSAPIATLVHDIPEDGGADGPETSATHVRAPELPRGGAEDEADEPAARATRDPASDEPVTEVTPGPTPSRLVPAAIVAPPSALEPTLLTRRRTLWLTLALVAMLLLGTGLGAAWLRGQAPPEITARPLAAPSAAAGHAESSAGVAPAPSAVTPSAVTPPPSTVTPPPSTVADTTAAPPPSATQPERGPTDTHRPRRPRHGSDTTTEPQGEAPALQLGTNGIPI